MKKSDLAHVSSSYSRNSLFLVTVPEPVGLYNPY